MGPRGQPVQFTESGLTLGAGLGIVAGVLIGGWAIAVGLVIGAAVGLVIGAAADARQCER